jgi:hypothetical protein
MLTLKRNQMRNEAADMGAGFVYVQTNEPERNRLLAFRRADDGTLTPAGGYETGGAGKRQPRDAAPGEIEGVDAVMAGPAGLTLGNTDAAAASLAQAGRLAAGPFRPGMQRPGDTRMRSVRQAGECASRRGRRSGTAHRGSVRHQQ